MFGYYTGNKSDLSRRIGKFLSETVQWEKKKEVNGETTVEFVSCEEVNEWDRFQLAELFLATDGDGLQYLLINENNIGLFKKDISVKIDELIPVRYFMKYHEFLGEKSKYWDELTQLKGIKKQFRGAVFHEETRNLVCYYKHKSSMTKLASKQRNERLASPKQVKFLIDLADENGMYLKKIDTLTMDIVSELIEYFKGERDESEFIAEFLDFYC